MALRLTGSDECELLIIETKEFILNIKGRPFHPTAQGLSILPSPEDAGDGATLHIAGAYISAHSYDPGRSSHLREYLPGVLVHPCFFEQTIYQVVIENKTQTPLVFFHPYQKYRNRVGPIGSTGRILVGNLNFENEVGLFTFQISKSGAPLLDVTLEVFPSKLDYRGDYLRLIEEVNKEVYGLAYDLLRSTYMGAKQQASRPATRNEYVSIIRVVFASLENAVLRIMRSPHQALVTSYETIRVDKARRADSTTRKSLLRARHWTTSECGLTVNGTKMAPRSIQDARKKVSHDTYENRVLKWMLQSVSVRLADSIKRLEATNSQSQELSAELKVMQRRLTGMLKHQLLAEVGVVHRIDGPSLVLQLAPGYRDVYKYFLMLQRGLFLQNSLFKLSLKDIALLYEYWCYLALGGLFRHKYDLKRQTVIAIKERGLVVMLDRTQKSELEFCNRFSGERYTLRYNPSQQGLPTTGQRPDTILTLEKNGSGVQYKYILDAKYRINCCLSPNLTWCFSPPMA